MNLEPIKTHILEVLDSLSPKALEELAHFVDFLHFKEHPQDVGSGAQPPGRYVKLEGLWKELPFDIADEDVRHVRHELMEQLKERQDRQ